MCCFHAVYWPAILLAAGLAPPRRITAHGFLLQRGDKIAKSGVRAVALDDLIDRFGADGLRYHLLRDNPVGPDGDFSVAGIEARYTADLANTLGNLLSRVTALVTGPSPAPTVASALAPVAAECVAAAASAWEDAEPSTALAATWRLVAATNSYLVANAPWKAPAGSEAVVGDALEALRIIALLAWPAIPTAAETIHHALGLPSRPDALDLGWGTYPGGLSVSRTPPLFPRLP